MTSTCRWLCRQLRRPFVLFLLALLVLFGLLQLPSSFRRLLIILLLLLALIGLLALLMILARVIARLCRKAAADPKGQGSVGRRGAPSVRIPSHTYKRPDPMIYSQAWYMAQGLAVTWDNPDIQLEQNGSPVSSHELSPSTTYRIRAQIWNGSTEAPAVNLLVRFYYLSFGIGTTRQYIGETLVNLPVKGAPGFPVVAEHAWTTPGAQGHYCIQVELIWPDDANPHNNLGQENVDVKSLNSPTATYQFVVRNDAHFPRTIVLEADGYVIPALPACPPGGMRDERRTPDRSTVRRDARERHSRAMHPVPPDCVVNFLPSDRLHLEPREEKMVTVQVVAPDGFKGRRPINVNAFAAGEVVGGVTLYFHD